MYRRDRRTPNVGVLLRHTVQPCLKLAAAAASAGTRKGGRDGRDSAVLLGSGKLAGRGGRACAGGGDGAFDDASGGLCDVADVRLRTTGCSRTEHTRTGAEVQQAEGMRT